MPNVLETATRTRNELLRAENATTTRLIRSYEQMYSRLQNAVTALESDIALLASSGRLTPYRVTNLTRYGALLNQIEDEISKYGGIVDNENRLATSATIDRALSHSRLLTSSYFSNPSIIQAFNATWDSLPKDAIESLLGFLAPDSELTLNLNTLGQSASRVFQDKLMEGIAFGYNPNKVTSAINNALGQPLDWVLSTVRTTQLYAYRDASRANYLNNSEIVSGWKWYASLDGRCCMSCYNQHGRLFTLEQALNDHHQGRCTQIPILPDKYGITQPDIEAGESQFNSLPETEQITRMGKAMHAAWKKNEFQFSELSQPYQNNVYGEMIKEASLIGLIGDRAANYYAH